MGILKKPGGIMKYQGGGRTDPKTFTSGYINSPKYKERLESSGYNAPAEIAARQSNVQPIKTYGQYGNPTQTQELKFENMGRPYTAGGGSSFLPKQDAIVIDHKQAEGYGIEPSSIEAHEFGHAETGVGEVSYDGETGIRNSRLNDYDNIQIGNKLKEDANPVYNRVPDEIKSDLNSLRYEFFNKGIYDAGTEDFKEGQLDKLDGSYIKDRLLKNYSKKDLQWLMNNIAMNKGESTERLQQRSVV